jgi:uncharacterized membrane protein
VGTDRRFRGFDIDRAVAMVFAVFVVASLAVDAGHRTFWQRAHDTAPVAGIVMLLLVVALLRRHRWAWWIFLIASVAGLPSFIVYRVVRDGNWTTVVGLIVGLVQLALLLSKPMRRYVGIGRSRQPPRANRPVSL